MSSLQIFEVVPDVLCVRRAAYLSCSYVVRRGAGAVLVDAGIDPDGRDMLAGLAHIGLGPRAITDVLLTHWHNDHSAGAEAIRAASGANVHYALAERPHFTRGAVTGVRARCAERVPEYGPLSALKAWLGESPPRAIEASHFVADGEIVAGGFRVIATPGHSRGHTSYFLEDSRVLFAGDALAVCSDRVAFMSRFLTEDLVAARESMRRCLTLDARTICPGRRRPLVAGVAEKQHARLADLEAGVRWPLFA